MESTIEKRLLEHLRSPSYRPQNKSEIARTLEISPNDRAELRNTLRRLEQDGTLTALKRGRYSLRSAAGKGNVLVGTLRIRQGGDAYFLPDLSDPQNRESNQSVTEHTRIYVGRRFTGTALPGDRVAVSVEQSGIPKWWKHVAKKRELIRRLEESGEVRWSGRVVKVIERARNRFVGSYQENGKFRYVVPDEPTIPTIDILEKITSAHAAGPGDSPAAESSHPQSSSTDFEPAHAAEFESAGGIAKPQPGQKVLVNVIGWASRHSHPHGEIIRVLGDADAPGVDVLSIIHRHQLPTEFPPNIVTEAEFQAARGITEDDIASREDWRDRGVLTIDPEDAKDFDDAICVTELEGGGWELAVHIADVSHYVRPGTSLDQEALERGNSTYLVDRVIPMLPEALSNGICSLRPEEDRLTRAAVMEFDQKGKRTTTRFIKSIIRSRKRLTYEQATAIMRENETGAGDTRTSGVAVSSTLKRAWDLAKILRALRFEKGSLDLDFPEIKVVLDDSGKPVDLRTIEYDESHQLIEEFMLAANEAVAQELKKRTAPAIYRIHDDPDEEKLYDFRDLARQFGQQAGDLTHRPELQKLLKAIKGTPGEHTLKIGLLKSLKRAVYHADPQGHYGLAKTDYTHFTSPIRRYADLVVHRVLFKDKHDAATPRYARMQEIADHISETERTSAAAEMESVQLKKIEYMAELARGDPNHTFEALIYDVRRIGLFVEIGEIQLKGLVKAEDLPGGDDYDFDRALQRFEGHYHGRSFELGQSIQVRLKSVNKERNFIDFRAI